MSNSNNNDVFDCVCLRTYHIHMFTLSEMNDHNDRRDGKRNSDYFVNVNYSHHVCSCIVLFESGQGLVINAYYKLWSNH